MKNIYVKFLLGCLLCFGGNVMGQISLTNGGPSNTQNFDAMAATTNLPSGWRMAASTGSPTWAGGVTTVTQQASAGAPSAGGTYNFGTTPATDRAVGAMTSGGFGSPNNLMSQYTNDGTTNITSLTVSFDAERYRINTAAASVQFYYSTNGTSWTSVAAGDIATSSFPTGTSAYTFGSPLTVSRTSIAISSLTIAPASSIYLRWNINTTGTNSQGIAIDNVVTTATFVAAATPSITLADNGTQVAAANVTEGTTNHILHQFQLSVTTANASLTGINCTTNGGYDAADITNLKVRYSTDAILDAGDATLSILASPGVAGAKTFPSFTAQAINSGNTGYIFVTADIAAASASGGNTIGLDAIATGDLTFASGTKTGTTTAGGTQTIVANTTPGLSVNTLSGFGSQCINGTYGPNSFTITGTALTTANVTVGPLTGYTFATASGGPYNTSLSLSQPGGTYSQAIYVQFVPTAAVSYNGNIPVGGGGATSVDVAATGTGINTAPAVTTVTATGITETGASSGGNAISVGCGTITAKGVVWGLAANPTVPSVNSTNDGTGTANYTSAITGLTGNTTYNYRAYVTNSNGITSYGSNLTFVTLKAEPTNYPGSFACGTTTANSIPLSWNAAVAGVQVPDGYIIKWSSISYAAIPDPVDGVAEANSSSATTGVQNVTGTTYTANGLTSSTTYYFKIWSYTNSGTGINYKLGSEPQTSCATLAGPCLSDNFNSGYGNWGGGSGTYQNATAGNTGNGTGFNDVNDDIILSAPINAPAFINFKGSASGTTAAFTVKVQYSVNAGGPWTDAATIAANGSNSGAITTTWNNYSFPLSLSGANYLRIIVSARTTGSFYLDDVEVYCTTGPEIDIQGNTVSIASGDNTPSLTDHTDFGSTPVTGGTVTRTFTILNVGSAGLMLIGSSPYVVLSGANAADFSITSIPSPSIAASTSTTFQITFDPSAIGVRTALVTIANDDANESPYTFSIQGTGSNSNLSSVVDNTNYATGTPEFNSDVQYINFINGTSTTTGKFIPMKFKVVDGPDADALGTTLTGIKFTVRDLSAVSQLAMIKTAILTTTGGTVLGTATKAGQELVFTGLTGITAADNNEQIVHLRVSLDETQVIDKTKLVFKVSEVTADPSGSLFAATDGGGAQTDANTGNLRNVLNVTATQLAFSTQPTTTSINTNMAPSPVVSLVDIYGRKDIDINSGTVSVTSTGTLTTTPQTATVANGDATFNTINHTASGTGFTLTASYGVFANVGSNPFDITEIVFVNGDYRTTGSGNWLSNQASPAIWERFNGTTWAANNSPAYNTSNNVYIRNGHTITTGGSFGSSVNMKVMDGGIFNNNHSSTTNSLYIYSGGSVNLNAALQNNTTFDVEDNANVVINFAASGTSALWNGTENFRPASTFTIANWNATAGTPEILTSTNITANNYNGYSAAFGNLTFDFTTNPGDHINVIASGVSGNLAHGNLYFKTSPTVGGTVRSVRISTTGTVNSGIGGNFIVDDLYEPSGVINFKTSGTGTFTIKGNMQVDAATVRIFAGGSSGNTSTVNIDGDLNITPSGALDFNTTVAGGVNSIINLKGDLTIAASGLLQNSNSSQTGILNFTGIGDGLTAATTQTVDIASTSANENRYINFVVNSGAYVQLANRDLEIGTNSGVIVNNGGTLDFGFSGTTALNVVTSGGMSGTVFSAQQGSILKITSPDGIWTTGTAGNVRTVPSNRNFNQVAHYWYVGIVNQVTGNGLTATSGNPKIVYVNLLNNTDTLRLTNNIGISNGTTLDALGGRLDIRKGTVIGTGTGDFIGNGRLVMSDGEYIISTITAAPLTDYLPQLSNYSNYSLTGGIVHLNGANATQILSATPDYYKLRFSGSNTLGANYKGISNATDVVSSIAIGETAIVDVKNSSLGGTPNSPTFTMTNTSRYITAGTGTKPDANGTYTLATTSTIEFNNNAASDQNIRLAPSYANIVVSGSSVANASLTSTPLTIQSGCSFTVTSTGTFKHANIHGFSGAGNTCITTVPTINLQDGSTISYYRNDGAAQVISNQSNIGQGATGNYYNLTLAGSGNKTAPSGNLNIGGSLTGIENADFVHNNGIVNMNGNVAGHLYSATRPFSFYEFYNNNLHATGLAINSDMYILRRFGLGDDSRLALNAGNIVIRSTAANTANVAQVPPTATISYLPNDVTDGRFVVERYISHTRRWQLFSVPVNSTQSIRESWQNGGLVNPGVGVQITGPVVANGIDAYSVAASMKYQNGTTPTFTPVTATNGSGSLLNGRGYYLYVYGDRTTGPSATPGPATTLNTRGKLFIGNGEVGLEPPAINIAATAGDNISIGNPFASAINFVQLRFSSTNLAPNFKVWDPSQNGNYGAGIYQTISGPTGWLATPGFGSIYNLPGNYSDIQSGQAFFVQAINTANIDVPFSEDMKVDAYRLANRGGNNPAENVDPASITMISTFLVNNAGVLYDGNRVVFDDIYSKAVDENDALKMMNDGANFGINNTAKILAVEARGSLSQNDTIQYHLGNIAAGQYQLRIAVQNINEPLLQGELVDRFLNSRTPVSLTDSSFINFAVTSNTASAAANRFYLVFKTVTVVPVTFTTVWANRKEDKTVDVNWKVENELNMSSYEVERSSNGSSFTKVGAQQPLYNGAGGQYQFNDATAPGTVLYYRIKGISINGQVQYSAIVKVGGEKTPASFVIYPNPATGKQVNVQLSGIEAGAVYELALYDVAGKLVHVERIRPVAGTSTINLRLKNELAAGTYRLQVADGKKETISLSLIVQ